MFDKGIEVVAISNDIVYSKGDVFISYGRHPRKKEYFAIKLKDRYCEGLVPESECWWAKSENFMEVEEEN